MWNCPGPGLEPVSPLLAGGFLNTRPPGKPWDSTLYIGWSCIGLSGLEDSLLTWLTHVAVGKGPSFSPAFGRRSQFLAMWTPLSSCVNIFMLWQLAAPSNETHTHAHERVHTCIYKHTYRLQFLWHSFISHHSFYHFLFIRIVSPKTAYTVEWGIRPHLLKKGVLKNLKYFLNQILIAYQSAFNISCIEPLVSYLRLEYSLNKVRVRGAQVQTS